MKITNVMATQEVQRINPAIRTGQINPARQGVIGSGAGFQEVLRDAIDNRTPLQFSKHAGERLSARDIQLSDTQMQRVEDGVHKARIKGVRDSLVIVDDVALVVNVQNKIVVTALDKGQNDGNVFTNIDGAVIV
jgi:flagellar operon protein